MPKNYAQFFILFYFLFFIFFSKPAILPCISTSSSPLACSIVASKFWSLLPLLTLLWSELRYPQLLLSYPTLPLKAPCREQFHPPQWLHSASLSSHIIVTNLELSPRRRPLPISSSNPFHGTPLLPFPSRSEAAGMNVSLQERAQDAFRDDLKKVWVLEFYFLLFLFSLQRYFRSTNTASKTFPFRAQSKWLFVCLFYTVLVLSSVLWTGATHLHGAQLF